VDLTLRARVSATDKRGARESISAKLGGHQNSLGLIRLVLASAVIFDHGFPLGGFGPSPGLSYTHGQATVGSLAVTGFFIISGYLITKSGMSVGVLRYIWRRVLRIFPAYWVALVVAGFVVAPIVWVAAHNTLAGLFSQSPNTPQHYFAANWTLKIGTYGVQDIFTSTTPYGLKVNYSVLNGSIWTLIYEWQCYLIIAVLVAVGSLRHAKIVVPAITALMFVAQIFTSLDQTAFASVLPFLADPQRVTLTYTFMLGATLAIYAHRIAYSDRWGVLAGVVTLSTLYFGGFLTVGLVAATYLVMHLAIKIPANFQWIGARNDYSYGIYVYGFLVEQVIAHLGGYKLGYFPFVMATLLVTLCLAWLSWHVVERPAMSLKNWRPGRPGSCWKAKINWLSSKRRNTE